MSVRTRTEKLTAEESGVEGGYEWRTVNVERQELKRQVGFHVEPEQLTVTSPDDTFGLSWKEWDAVVERVAAAREAMPLCIRFVSQRKEKR